MYADEMTDSVNDATTILRYVITIQRREFLIDITSDSISCWDDHTPHLDLLHEVQDEMDEFTISIPLPENIFLKARAMQHEPKSGEFKKMNEKTARNVGRGVKEMDQLLVEFFWREVNPRLKQPLTNPRKACLSVLCSPKRTS